MALALWELTLEDLVHSDVSDKLLYSVVFQVAVSSVHLKCLVANLLGLQEATLRAWEKKKKTDFRTAENIMQKEKKKKLTLKHSSVTKSLAMEQRETASGLFSCSAVAAWRTSRRDATRLVAISASLNCRYCKTQWGTQSVVERASDLLKKNKK